MADDLPRKEPDPRIVDAERRIRSEAQGYIDDTLAQKADLGLDAEALEKERVRLESQYLPEALEEDAGWWDQWVRSISKRTGYLEPMPLPPRATPDQKTIIGNLNKRVEENNKELRRLYGEQALSVPTETHGQHLMRVIGNFGGVFPLFREGALSVPVPEASKAAAAMGFEKLKNLPPMGEMKTSQSLGATMVWNQLSRQFEGEADEGKIDALKQVYDKERKEGNWISMGELFLGQTARERGLTRDDWVSRSLEGFEKGTTQ